MRPQKQKPPHKSRIVTSTEPMQRSASPDESLIADESYTATSSAGLTYPWGRDAPSPGRTIPIAPGINWARIPMPGSLGHINSWLLDDHDGVAVVDTGLMLTIASDEWKALFAGPLEGKTVSRVICTHMHPDHIGLAGWLCKRFDAPLWMTRGEWLTARMLSSDAREAVPEEVSVMQHASGWTEAQVAEFKKKGWSRFAKMIFDMPLGYRRIVDGEVLDMGAHKWRVVTGSGHSPEHACLFNEAEGVLVSGDQVLPRISSNVSMNTTEPDADPLGEWLDSIEKLLTILPADLLVCPAHGEPFTGLHIRLAALRDEHHGRLDRLAKYLETPRRVVDCFGQLFNREIGDEQIGLATGEAQAHLRYLELTNRAVLENRDGVHWYHAA
jgi:glyoxylase-like metal-dependent hydrolase (beta-lactamase superfamily II)